MEKTIARILIVLYIFFAAWTGSFVFGRYLTISNIILLLIMPVMLYSWFRERYSLRQLFKEDGLLLILIIGLGIAAAVHYNGHSLNYIVAYGFVFVAGFLLLKLFFIRYSSHKLLLNAISVAVVFQSLFILVEFFGQTLFGFDIQEYMFKIYPHDALYSDYPRCFGFTEEPTYVAHYLVTFAPLVFYHIHKTLRFLPLRVLLYAVVVASFLLTFSTAGFAILLIGALLSIGFYSCSNISFFKKNWIWITLLILTIILGAFIVFTKDIPALQPLLYKLTSADVGNEGSRLNRWVTDYPYFLRNPIFGVGPGFFASMGLTSSVNWYLFLAIEAGLVSLIPLLLFLGFYLYRITTTITPYRFLYLYGFLCTSVYLFTCSTFYHPYPWLLLIIFSVCAKNSPTSSPKRKVIIRMTTVPESLKTLLKGQLKYINTNSEFEVIGVSSPGEQLEEVERIEGIKCYPISMSRTISPIRDVISIIKLYFLIRKIRPYIVHTHTPKAGMVGMVASFLGGVPNRFHTVAGLPLMETEGMKRNVLTFVEKVTYRLATKVLSNSIGLRNFIITNKFLPPSKIQVLGFGSSNGIDLDHYSRKAIAPNVGSNLRKEYGINTEDILFVFIGRIVSHKGIDELLHAFSRFSLESNRVKLILVGGFENDLDPISKESLNCLKLGSVFHVGHKEDVRPFLAAADVFVFPSYREGFPNVILQACAYNIPCIVTDINGCKEMIKDNIDGFIIPSKDEEQLYFAMRKFIDHPELLNSLGRKSRDNISVKFDQQFLWLKVLDFYNLTLDVE